MGSEALTVCEVCGAVAECCFTDHRSVEFDGREVRTAVERYCCKQHRGIVFQDMILKQEKFHEHCD